jgi:hypothetical protein
METYRKTDQEYIDNYDRYTIEKLKELERSEPDASIHDPLTKFFNEAVSFAQNKNEVIRSRMNQDERKDRLIANTAAPKNVTCNVCNSVMQHETYFFEEESSSLLFVFNCTNKHPKKVLYSDGKRERPFRRIPCDKCGGEMSSNSEKNEGKLKIIRSCANCANKDICEYDLSSELPIIGEDRKKYCTDWIGRTTFLQDFKALSDFAELHFKEEEEKMVKEQYRVDKVERINVPRLEDILFKAAAESQFIKFKFDNIETKSSVIVAFSTQDPTDRNEKESVKNLTSIIKTAVYRTNWRLTSEGVDYRLGVLSGRLKGIEDDEGLLKIAKEIFNEKRKKRS